jgi:hypothetical protein
MNYAQDHCDTIRPKNALTAPLFTEVIPGTIFFLLHIIARGATYTLLFVYCPVFGFVIIAVIAILNLLVCHSDRILKWGCPDDYELWNEHMVFFDNFAPALMSIVAPSVGRKGFIKYVAIAIIIYPQLYSIRPRQCKGLSTINLRGTFGSKSYMELLANSYAKLHVLTDPSTASTLFLC